MTISLYKHLVIDMTPTPAKMHYIFNLRDISKVKIIQNNFHNRTRLNDFYLSGISRVTP